MQSFRRSDLYARLIFIETILILFFFALCIIPATSAFAATVNLAWNASSGSNVAGYKMYYGTSSRKYSYNVKVGNYKSCSLSGLQEGKKYYFAATAYNSSNVESNYSSEISYTVPTSASSGSTNTSTASGTSGSSNTLILDNGGSGTSSSGYWRTSGASGPYGANSLISNSVGATYTFQASRSGAQDVYIWYTYWSDRYTNVPVKIYTSSGVITKTVNQKQNAGKWNFLGTYNFSGQAKVVIESKTSSATTSADAVKFTPAGSSTSSGTSSGSTSSGTSSGSTSTGTSSGTSSTSSTSTSTSSGTSGSSNTLILDNGGSGTSSSGSWVVSGGSNPYGTKSVYSKSVGATYTFQTSRSGDQDVYIWYTYWSDRYTNVPVKIYTSSGVITKTVNQKQNAGKWNFLGTYNFSGQAKVVIESKTSSATTSADAVKFTPAGSSTSSGTSSGSTSSGTSSGSTSTGTSSGTSSTSSTSTSTSSGTSGSSNTLILDNGGSGTSSSGSWVVSGGSNPYGTKSVYSKSVGATYTFQTSRSGDQDVYIWYTYWSDRYTNVPVKIYTSSGVITKTVNQKQNAGKWNFLGTYNFSGQAKVVIESKTSSATTNADAVKFAPAGSSSSSGTTGSSSGTIASTTALILDNGVSGTSSSGYWRTSGASGPYGANSLISKSVGATYTFQASRSGDQDVYIWYTYWSDRYTNVPVKIYTSSGVITKTVNQKQNAGKWNFLGTFNFSGQAKVVIESKSSSATTSADAVLFVPAP